jgi:hypothetical protein
MIIYFTSLKIYTGPLGTLVVFSLNIPPVDFETIVDQSDDEESVCVIRKARYGDWILNEPRDILEEGLDWVATWVASNDPGCWFELHPSFEEIPLKRMEGCDQVGVRAVLQLDSASKIKSLITTTDRSSSTALVLELYSEFGEGLIPGGFICSSTSCLFGPFCSWEQVIVGGIDEIVDIFFKEEEGEIVQLVFKNRYW